MATVTLHAELLVDCANHVGESPVWDATRQQLLWLDIPQGKLLSRDSAGRVQQWQSHAPVGSIALAEDGSLIAGTKEGFVALTVDGKNLRETSVALVLADQPDMRLNDGACDRRGRFWSGSMPMPVDPANPRGVLYRLAGQQADAVLDGFLVQNGLAWSPDGRTMYVADSHSSRASIWVLDYDGETGTPSNRRLFVDLKPYGGRPDGAAIDADGCYWIAATGAGRLIRFTPEGRADAEVTVPTSNPTNLCFGGPDNKTIFITSLRPAVPDAMAGHVFACEVPWQGLAEMPFAMGAWVERA